MRDLQIRNDLSEDAPYTSPHLPIRSVVGRLSNFLMHSADCHWHQDLEFIVIQEGEMAYHVNDQVYPLHKGDGLFVNTNRLHFGAALKPGSFKKCVFYCMLLHPSLLCAHPYIEERFINPLLYDSHFDAFFFPSVVEGWRIQALERIKVLMELAGQSPDDSALELQSQFYGFISLLLAHTAAGQSKTNDFCRDDSAIKQMISFIHNHFTEKITLDEIAHAGAVCRSKCCFLFKQSLRKSVFDYLLHFRIRRSLALLADKSLSITDIALASGFSAASYYGEIFKRILGMSPGEYRRKFRGGSPLPYM